METQSVFEIGSKQLPLFMNYNMLTAPQQNV